jgi:putative SOS response-associated peptidase YedK
VTSPFLAVAFRAWRCIVQVDQYFQRSTKVQPGKRFSIQRADGTPMAWAGLWEGHRDSAGTVTRSYCVITTETNALLSSVHDRMPVVLEAGNWPVWLGGVEGDASTLLRPADEGVQTIRPLTAR